MDDPLPWEAHELSVGPSAPAELEATTAGMPLPGAPTSAEEIGEADESNWLRQLTDAVPDTQQAHTTDSPADDRAAQLSSATPHEQTHSLEAIVPPSLVTEPVAVTAGVDDSDVARYIEATFEEKPATSSQPSTAASASSSAPPPEGAVATQASAPDQQGETNRNAPLPSSSAASPANDTAHASQPARQPHRASVTDSHHSRQTANRSSRRSTKGGPHPEKDSGADVVRESSQPLVTGSGKSRAAASSRTSRHNSRSDAQRRATTMTSSRADGTAAKPKRRGPAPAGATYNRDNFFFAGDDVGTEFGMGTTGLYAAKVAPVVSTDRTRTVPSRLAGAEKAGTGNRDTAPPQGEPNALAATAPDRLANTMGDSQRAYFTSAFYTKVPEGYHESKWAQKENAFDEWRASQLQRSTYHTYGKSSDKRSGPTEGRPAEQTTAQTTEPWLDPASFYTDEEAQAFERRRTAAIAAERLAKARARESRIDKLEADLAAQHREYQRGEPAYLPDAYFETTLAQERVTQLPGNHLTCSDPYAVITPRDHHRAQVAYRQYQGQLAEARVATRQHDARKYRERITRDVTESRKELDAFQAQWLDGLPRLSRADACAKARAAEEAHRDRARLNAEEDRFNRGIYAMYRENDEARHREHLAHLRTKLPAASQDRLRDMRAKAARKAAEEAETCAQSKKPQATDAPGVSAKPTPHTPTPAPPSKPTDAVPSPPPPYAATSTSAPEPIPLPPRSFVAEVQQWQDTFRSPNAPPLNAQDPEHRREWLRRLSGERRAFKQGTVEQGRSQPIRVQQATVDMLEQRAKVAETQRQEAASLRERRLEVEAENHAYTTSLYELNRDGLARVRSARQEVSADRQMSASAQRCREKEVDALMRSLEEEEWQHAREAVMSARS